MRIILLFVSVISSNVRKTRAPTFLAQLMQYLALSSRSSGVTPGVMMASSTARESMACTRARKKRELADVVSLMLRRRRALPAASTRLFAQRQICSSSTLEMPWVAASLSSTPRE